MDTVAGFVDVLVFVLLALDFPADPADGTAGFPAPALLLDGASGFPAEALSLEDVDGFSAVGLSVDELAGFPVLVLPLEEVVVDQVFLSGPVHNRQSAFFFIIRYPGACVHPFLKELCHLFVDPGDDLSLP